MGAGRKYPKVEVQELREDFIKFKLSNTNASIANALRRVIIGEVPTLAIDLVSIETNSSVLPDEFIAHRLGLVPLCFKGSLDAFKESFNYSQDCACDEYCPRCAIEFHLDVTADSGPRTVTSQDLVAESDKVQPVHFSSEEEQNNSQDSGITLLKLGRGQRIKLSAIAKLGIAKEHSKWCPVAVATYMYEPKITLNSVIMDTWTMEQKAEFVKSCPTKVYEADDNYDVISVSDRMKCMYCDECVKVSDKFKANPEDDGLVKVEALQDTFIFSIEANGVMKPEDIVVYALDILRDKLSTLKHQCMEIKQEELAPTSGLY